MRLTTSFNAGVGPGPIPPGQLPFTMKRSPGTGVIIFIVLFTVSWLGLSVAGLIASGTDPEITPGAKAFIVLFGFIGFVPLTVFHFKDRFIEVHIDEKNVVHRQRGILGPWKETTSPLSAYLGVSEHIIWTGKDSDVPVYVVRLHHAEHQKNIHIAFYDDALRQRKALESFSKLFRLDILDIDRGQIVSRTSFEDADLSLMERLNKQGQSDRTELKPYTGKLYVLETAPGGFILTRTFSKMWLGALIPLLAGALLLFQDINRGAETLVPGFVFTILGMLFLCLQGSRMKLVVDKDRITSSYHTLFGTFRKISIPVSEIEHIRIADVRNKDRKGFESNRAVQVVADGAIINFGNDMKPADKEWLRDSLTAFIYTLQKVSKK